MTLEGETRRRGRMDDLQNQELFESCIKAHGRANASNMSGHILEYMDLYERIRDEGLETEFEKYIIQKHEEVVRLWNEGKAITGKVFT